MDPRSIPSVDAVLSSPLAAPLREAFPHDLLVEGIRTALGTLRERVLASRKAPETAADVTADGEAAIARVVDDVAGWIEDQRRPAPRPVVNATGVVLHTNLGRAPLPRTAIDAIGAVVAGSSALEFDLASGKRGDRDDAVRGDLVALTGAEDALVVNNNAAALLLVLDTLARRREVIVSRGELIEIGGSFRLPDMLERSGAILREVGTTNRTRIGDVDQALRRSTALILRTHPSNYRIEGFTEQPTLRELATLARERDVPFCEDLGSGALIDLSRFGLPREPTPAESIEAGVDLVTFSGDKLLGGPQAGLIVGRADLVRQLRKNPLRRALRPGKLTLAALAATLQIYRTAQAVETQLPALVLLTRPIEELEARAREVAPRVRAALGDGFEVDVVASEAEIGSGAQPTMKIESRALVVRHADLEAHAIAARLRAAQTPIVGRIQDGGVLLDLRSVLEPASLIPQFPQESPA